MIFGTFETKLQSFTKLAILDHQSTTPFKDIEGGRRVLRNHSKMAGHTSLEPVSQVTFKNKSI